MPDPHKAPTAPEGWTEIPLGQVGDVVFSSVDKKSWSSEPPVTLCNYLDVYQNDYLGDDHLYMEATASYAEIRKFGLRPGDVLITKDSETPDDIGIPAVLDSVVGTLVCGYHLALIRPGANVNPVFLAKQIGHERIQRYFGKKANGITRYGLSTASVMGLPLWLPPIREQHWISVALRTLDDAIRRTEQVIAKLQQMKQGLLHDLLTRGVDEHGDLRPTPDEAPDLYKDSPLGRIPVLWEEVPFHQLCLTSAFGPRFSSDLYADDGNLATLRTTDMDDEGNIALGTMPLARVPVSSVAQHLLELDDLVVSRSGTCGIAGVFPGFHRQVVPGAFLIRFRLRQPRLAHYYRRYFNSPLGRPRLAGC